MRIVHTYVPSICKPLTREIIPDPGPKGDENYENLESKVRGLEGDVGQGLGWLRGQAVIDDFNNLNK